MSRLNQYISLESHSAGGALNAVELERSFNEIALESTEIENMQSDIMDLENIALGLESLAESVSATLADGGLDTTGGVLLQHAAQAYAGRLGMTTPLTPSQESFGSSGERMVSTQISTESLKETAVKIWDAIVQAVKDGIKKIKEWIRKIMDSLPGIKKAAEALKEKAENVEGSKKENKLKIGKAGNALAVGKTVASLDTITTSVKTLTTMTFGELHVGALKTAGMIASLDKIEKDTKTDDAETAMESFQDKNSLFDKDINAEHGKKFTGSFWKATSPNAYPGNMLLGKQKEVIPASGLEKVEALAKSYKLSFVNVAGKSDMLDSDAEIDAPDSGDVMKACDTIIDICDTMSEFGKQYDKIEKAKEACLKAGGQISKELDKNSEITGDTAKLGKAMARANQKAATTLLDQPFTAVNGYAISTMRAVLAVGDKAIANYKKD